MKNKSLGLNAFLNGLKITLNLLFPLITFPYVSRVLGVKGIGVYNYSNSIVSYFLLIAALGISTYAIREGAKYRDDKKQINEFASEIFTINICSTLVSYILLFACLIIFTNLHDYVSCILIFSVQIFFTTLGMDWVYSIYEDYAYITVRSISFQIISLILLFIFVRSKNDYLNYAIITVFSSVGSNIFNFVHARMFVKVKLTWDIPWKHHLLPIFIIFASNVAIMVFVNSDITILGIMKNTYVVGLYSVAAKVYSIIKNLLASLLIVTVPRLAMLMGKRRMNEYNKILTKVINMLLLFTLPAMTGLFMLSKEVVLIISGRSFLAATPSLQILCFALIFSLFSWVMSDCVLIPIKREKFVLIGTVISAIINICLNLILIPFWSEKAAALSTVAAEASMMISNLYFSRDIISKIIKSGNFRNNLLSSLLGCSGIVLICWLCDIGWESFFLKTLFSIILSVVIYGAILIFLNNATIISIMKGIKNKFIKYK